MSKAGLEIIAALEDAVAGKFARVTLKTGEVWIRETPPYRATADLLSTLKSLCDAVEGDYEHRPQIRITEDDCPVCVGLYEAREAIAKAEKQS